MCHLLAITLLNFNQIHQSKCHL